MDFETIFREKYRVALRAARANDSEAVLAALQDLHQTFADQFALNNGDSIVIKAKLSRMKDLFGFYIQIVKASGLADRRVRKFFGLKTDDNEASPVAPNFPKTSTQAPSESGGLDIDGLIPPIDAQPQPIAPSASDPQVPIDPAEQPSTESPSDSTEDPAETEDASTNPEDTPATIEGVPIPSDETPAETVASPAYAPDCLEGFIGQAHIVKALLKEAAIAKAEGRRHVDNIMLCGNPGLGKTTLMRLFANKLGVRFEWMDCSQYRNSQQSLKALQNFLLRIARENEPVVIAFDEIHCLTEELQSSLLTLLESRIYVSPPDINGNVKRIPIDEFTFIAATTDDDKVLPTIKDRCLRLKFQLVDYTQDELAQIYRTKVAAMGLTITEEAIQTCIPRSRSSIRYVNSFVEGLNRELYDDNGNKLSNHIDLSIALRFFKERGIDDMGLENKDIEILNVLQEADSPMGVDTLSARVGLDPKKYLSEYEPYLIKIGFVNVSGRGRYLTDKAIAYLQSK